MMIYLLVCIMLFMEESKGEWKLVWNEEFQNTTLDTTKWEIENEFNTCHGNYIQQLNCNTNRTKNLRLIGGTLAMTAIYEKYLDKDYTSGRITTKQSFTYGRFEIRAALPNGKMLRSAIFMNPETYSPEWARNGQIDFITNIQNSKLGAGLHYNTNPAIYEPNPRGDYNTNQNLNNFHIYALEWDEFAVKWFFDDINHLTININRSLGPLYNRNGEPFDMPFKLIINLGVGDVNSKEVLPIEDVIDWKCSLLIIDYVRIYNLVNETENHNFSVNGGTAEKICSVVMPFISLKKRFNISFSTVVSVISCLLLLALIPLVVFLLIRQKRLKNIKTESEFDAYDDTNVDTDGYDVINTTEYAEPYQQICENYVECDQQEKSCGKTNLKENFNSTPIYLAMTNTTKNTHE